MNRIEEMKDFLRDAEEWMLEERIVNRYTTTYQERKEAYKAVKEVINEEDFPN